MLQSSFILLVVLSLFQSSFARVTHDAEVLLEPSPCGGEKQEKNVFLTDAAGGTITSITTTVEAGETNWEACADAVEANLPDGEVGASCPGCNSGEGCEVTDKRLAGGSISHNGGGSITCGGFPGGRWPLEWKCTPCAGRIATEGGHNCQEAEL